MVADHELPESLRLVPGLEVCDVLESAPDGSWQTIRHVMNFSWYLPKLTYIIRASYDQPSKVSIERVSGDSRSARFVGIEQRRRLHGRALYGRPGARLLGTTLDRAIGAAQGFPQNARCAAFPC